MEDFELMFTDALLKQMDSNVHAAFEKSLKGDWSCVDDIKFLKEWGLIGIHTALCWGMISNIRTYTEAQAAKREKGEG